MEWIIGITTGLLSGILSGFLVTEYFRSKDRTKMIIKYGNQTADYAFEISEAAGEYLKGKGSSILEELLRRGHRLHREFDGDIPDKDLQKAIAGCNMCISVIGDALDNNDEQKLFHAHGEMSGKLLDLWNATSNYEGRERHKTKIYRENIRWIIAIISMSLIVLLSIRYS
jgi:hypothetical protein